MRQVKIHLLNNDVAPLLWWPCKSCPGIREAEGFRYATFFGKLILSMIEVGSLHSLTQDRGVVNDAAAGSIYNLH